MNYDNWQKIKLGDLIEVKHGFAFKGKFFSDKPQRNILLTPGNFAIGGGFKYDKLKYYVGEIPYEYILDEDDILITMTDLSKTSDTLGYPAIIPKSINGVRYLHNQRLGKVIIKDETRLDKRYIFYLLCTKEYRNEILASATGTAVKHTAPDRIRAFKFNVPPLSEQRAIAHILGTLDDKIELNSKMNETLEAMAQAIFKSWFVDFDPVIAKANNRQPLGMDAQTAALFPDSFDESELGKIPKGWKAGTIGNDFDINMGQSPPGNTYNEEGNGTPFYQGRRDFGFRYPSVRIYCTTPKRVAKTGDTLVSVRAPVGDTNMALTECCIGRGVSAVRHKSGSRSYTYYAMQSLQNYFARFEGEGTVFGSINKTQFNKLEFLIPAIKIRDKFEQIVGSMDEQIEMFTKQNFTLATIRDTLLPKLLSGKLRISNAEKFVEDIIV